MDAIDTNSIEQLLKINDTLKKYGISLSVLIFVACLENEDCNLTDIRDKLLITSAGMTTIRDCAESRKFIIEVNSEDRRAKVYQITDLGKELLASYRQ